MGAWLLLSEQGLPDEAFEGGLAGLPGVLRGREQSVEERDASYTALLDVVHDAMREGLEGRGDAMGKAFRAFKMHLAGEGTSTRDAE